MLSLLAYILSSIVIDDAMESFKNGNNPQPVFFYCARNEQESGRSDPMAILASIARQLSSVEPGKPLLKPAIEIFDKEKAQGFPSGRLRIGESCRLILELIENYPHTTVIIDALDECDRTTRLELLEALEQILQEASSPVKIFVSSRDYQDIVLRLRKYPGLEIDSRRNGDDIARFVKEEVKRLVCNQQLLCHSTNRSAMTELIEKKVIEGAGGM
jgi:hypothetical protein